MKFKKCYSQYNAYYNKHCSNAHTQTTSGSIIAISHASSYDCRLCSVYYNVILSHRKTIIIILLSLLLLYSVYCYYYIIKPITYEIFA